MLSPARITTAVLLSAATLLPGHAWAIDWDGDFPVDGTYDGKIDNPANWAFNTLPGIGDPAVFNANATYTVGFGVGFETAANTISNGDVTFTSLGSTQTYALNGVLNVVSSLTLDNLDFAPGSLSNFSLRVREGGTMLILGGNQSEVDTLTVGDFLDDGELTLDGASLLTHSANLIGAGTNGGIITLNNGSGLTVDGGSGANNMTIGRSDSNNSRLSVLGGSSVTINGGLFIADVDANTGNGVVELSGTGSSLEVVSGDTEIGSNGLSTAVFTVGVRTLATFGGDLSVFGQGTLNNFGGAVTVGGPTLIDGRFEHTGGTTDFQGTASIGSGSAFVHTGGTIRFGDTGTIAIQDLTIGGAIGTAWDVEADVAYNRRLRLAGDQNTSANITVDGMDAVLRNTGTGGQADLAVGFGGTSELRIQNLGEVDIFDDVIIGQLASGVGRVFVTGIGSADINERSVLRVNRNGSGSNLFVGLDGDGLLAVVGGGLVEVGNDLVIQATDTAGITSLLTVGADPSLGLESTDSVLIGGDLLIGNVGGMGGNSSGLAWFSDTAFVSVQGHTHVRATGELLAAQGSVLVTNTLTTESTSGFDIDGGAVRVFSGNATLNHGDLVITGDASVPNQGARGSFELYSGADAEVDGNLIIGDGAGTSGRLTLSGSGTTFSQVPGLNDAFVGDGGDGQILVTDGGSVDIRRAVNIATTAGSTGRVSISGVSGGGARSSMTVTGLGDSSAIRVGAGSATSDLVISDGAFVQTSGGVSIGNASIPGAGNHTVMIGGASGGFSAELLARNLTINGGTTSTLQINDGGLVVLQPNNPISTVFLINGSGATFEMTGGEFYTPRFFRSAGGTANWTGGTIYVDEVTGSLANNGGTLSPGSGEFSPYGGVEFSSDYTQAAAGTTRIEIGGTLRGTLYDFVDVDGTLSLAGTLDVVLLGSTPVVGDSFDLLDWGTLVGTFDTLNLPGVGNGNTWSLDNLYTTGVIEVIRSGDLDSDGMVGVADLDIILANWGQSVTPFDEAQGDVNGDGLVGDADLQAVLDQFGNTTYPTSSSVPEPGTLSMLAMLLIGRRRRQTTR